MEEVFLRRGRMERSVLIVQWVITNPNPMLFMLTGWQTLKRAAPSAGGPTSGRIGLQAMQTPVSNSPTAQSLSTLESVNEQEESKYSRVV